MDIMLLIPSVVIWLAKKYQLWLLFQVFINVYPLLCSLSKVRRFQKLKSN